MITMPEEKREKEYCTNGYENEEGPEKIEKGYGPEEEGNLEDLTPPKSGSAEQD